MFKILFSALVLSWTAAGASPGLFQVEVSGHGKPMILIPGLASSGDVWKSTVEHYSIAYECHVLTLAGFAGVAPVQGFSLDAAEAGVSAYINDKHLERPVIVGHSLGGFLALKLGADHPEQVGKLVIVDSLPAMGAAGNPGATAADLKGYEAQMSAAMLAETNEQRLKSSRSYAEGMVTAPADLDRIDGWSKASDWHTLVTAMSEMIGDDLRHKVGRITAPTLVMGTWVALAQYGGEAGIRKTFDTQYAELKGVQVAMAPKARHFIMYDDPQWMFAQMDGFLSAQGGNE